MNMVLNGARDVLKKNSCFISRMRLQAKGTRELKLKWNERIVEF